MRRLIIPIVLITIVSVTFTFVLSDTSIFRNIEDSTYDFRTQYLSPPTRVSEDIIMVWIDEDTIANLPYRSPVPRNFLTQLNEKLKEAMPLLIAYDIFFQDPTVPEMDDSLAKSFSEWHTYSVSAGKTQPNGKLQEEKPLELFQESLKSFGLSYLPVNAYDATARIFQPYMMIGGAERPTFAALLYKAVTGKSAAQTLEDSELKILGLTFHPFRKSGKEIWSYIRYAGPPGKIGGEENMFPIFPANLVAAGLVPKDWLTEKIVLVGSAYEYSQDAFLTPYFGKRYDYPRMNGVEIHANVLNDLLTAQFYYTPDNVQMFVLLALLAVIIALANLRGSLFRGLAIFVLLSIGYLFVSIFVFKKYGLIFPVISPLLVGILSLGLTLTWRTVTEGRQKRFIRNTFSKYVPPAVVHQMLTDPSKLVLGGETRNITSLFTDIESFTTISERLKPDVLVAFLNEYLSKLSDTIFKFGGMIDKYEGDAVIAFFGAPLELTHHEEKAIKAAIEIQKATREISYKWKDICGREIVTRIGINSGAAVVGNMGSVDRFDYTAIGDTVNLASRLESLNKQYGTHILFAESTKKNVSDEIKYRLVDKVIVKGKTEAVNIYEII